MTRELAAHHDPTVLSSPYIGAALAIHRAAPGLSLVELLERADRPGPASRAIEHAQDCGDCRVGDLCPAGEQLAREIGRLGPRQQGSTT